MRTAKSLNITLDIQRNMTELITLRLEKPLRQQLDLLSKAEDKDRSELVREMLKAGIQEKKITHALESYKAGKITLWKAARLADLSLWKMIDILRQHHVELQYGLEELKQDFHSLEE